MREAARWLGRFHRVWQGRYSANDLGFEVNRHDLDYYKAWVERVGSLSVEGDNIGWLSALAQKAHLGFSPILDSSSRTLIHGEFYPENILVSGERIWPIDWEWAAVAAGEIDLSALVESWPCEIITLCQQDYVESRWPEGVPAGFEERLRAADFYLHYRSLVGGGVIRWTPDGRIARLKALSEELGLL